MWQKKCQSKTPINNKQKRRKKERDAIEKQDLSRLRKQQSKIVTETMTINNDNVASRQQQQLNSVTKMMTTINNDNNGGADNNYSFQNQ